MAKEKLTKIVTPAGVAVYPHLHAPDTKFVAEGVYKLKLKLDADAAAKLIARIEPEFEKAKALVPDAARKAKNKPTRNEPWEEQEDGTFIFGEIKMKASGTNAKGQDWERSPMIFDAANQKLPEGTRIGGGSTLKVAVELYPYYMASTKAYGVALWLNAVQVIDLKTWGGGGNASDFGFEEEEDGYRADSFPSDDTEDEDEWEDKTEESDEEEGDYSAEDF